MKCLIEMSIVCSLLLLAGGNQLLQAKDGVHGQNQPKGQSTVAVPPFVARMVTISDNITPPAETTDGKAVHRSESPGLMLLSVVGGGFAPARSYDSREEDPIAENTPAHLDKAADLPTEFSLLQNYPNPFNPATAIRFDLPEAAFATLKVYDVLGREVETFVLEELPAGRHTRTWDASALASGVYIYRLEATSATGRAAPYIAAGKAILLK